MNRNNTITHTDYTNCFLIKQHIQYTLLHARPQTRVQKLTTAPLKCVIECEQEVCVMYPKRDQDVLQINIHVHSFTHFTLI